MIVKLLRDEKTTLMFASENGHEKVVTLLLDGGADVHAKLVMFQRTDITIFGMREDWIYVGEQVSKRFLFRLPPEICLTFTRYPDFFCWENLTHRCTFSR